MFVNSVWLLPKLTHAASFFSIFYIFVPLPAVITAIKTKDTSKLPIFWLIISNTSFSLWSTYNYNIGNYDLSAMNVLIGLCDVAYSCIYYWTSRKYQFILVHIIAYPLLIFCLFCFIPIKIVGLCGASLWVFSACSLLHPVKNCLQEGTDKYMNIFIITLYNIIIWTNAGIGFLLRDPFYIFPNTVMAVVILLHGVVLVRKNILGEEIAEIVEIGGIGEEGNKNCIYRGYGSQESVVFTRRGLEKMNKAMGDQSRVGSSRLGEFDSISTRILDSSRAYPSPMNISSILSSLKALPKIPAPPNPNASASASTSTRITGIGVSVDNLIRHELLHQSSIQMKIPNKN